MTTQSADDPGPGPVPPPPDDAGTDTGGITPPDGMPTPYSSWFFARSIVRIGPRSYATMIGIDPQFKNAAQVELHIPVPPGLTEPPAVLSPAEGLSVEVIFEPQVNADLSAAFAVGIVDRNVIGCIVNVQPEPV